MSGVAYLVRVNQTKDISPPRTSALTQCEDDPTTVVIQMGKSSFGQVYGSNYSLSQSRYMTKQQKELPK
jgi:hypothetical protein